MDRLVIDVAGRRVHLRIAGNGPPVLLVHQSPRSSAEYAPLMAEWAKYFTCIAPDSPGFGQSDPLDEEAPEVADFADALIALLDRIGIDRIGAYGFHSGASILAEAALRHPSRFTALALGGYPVWTEAERASFGQDYLPPFRPSAFGEHLVWAWNRLLEQSWFFPWYDVGNESRMKVAHADPERVQAMVCELLDSGDCYRLGYGAVFRAGPAIPGPEAMGPPVLISAYDGDPLQAHLDRLGILPSHWRTEKVKSREAHFEASRDFLAACPAPVAEPIRGVDGEGFVAMAACGFAGQIHWRGDRRAERIWLHAPDRSIDQLPAEAELGIDLPGHGLSDAWESEHLDRWAEIIALALRSIMLHPAPIIVGEGVSALLAAAVASRLEGARFEGRQAHLPLPDATRAWLDARPDSTPDRFGRHLVAGWARVRAETFFWPWFHPDPAHAIPFDRSEALPERLAIRHRDLVRARSGAALTRCLLTADRGRVLEQAPACTGWSVADWAIDHPEIWKPPYIQAKES